MPDIKGRSLRFMDQIPPPVRKYASISILVVGGLLIGWLAKQWLTSSKTEEKRKQWEAYSQIEASMGAASRPDIASFTLPPRLEPWARLLVTEHRTPEEPSPIERKELFKAIEVEFPDHCVVTGIAPGLGIQAVVASISAIEEWERSHPSVTGLPSPASDGRVRLVTDAGTIEIGLYPDYAPGHASNFRKLVHEGYYNGTRFHRVTREGIYIVQGGDPNTKQDDRSKWGLGGPDDGIKPERNKLSHMRGAVAMARPGSASPETKDSASQFYIVTKDSPSLDGQFTVFGAVISGAEVVDRIAAAELEPNTDRPRNPAQITHTELY
jgi:cyclophilin family peptidyl-prolyl cis-trans isomerase